MNKRKAEAKNGVRAIAGVLGIHRHEIGQYTRIKNEPPPLFPPIHKPLIPSGNASVQLLDYRCGIENEIVMHFNSLETNPYSMKKDFVTKKFSDDMLHPERETFVPAICDLPKGLYPLAVKRKMAKDLEDKAKKAKKIEELLSKLEKKEKDGEGTDELDETEDEERKDDEEEQEIVASDEDYFEEDNDYIHTYFDNGDGYHENPSDDNLEDGDY